MTDWNYIRFEYCMFRRQHGWRKALRLAIKANKNATDNIPF
jgi:hypothetical protein